jgi:hypothetical protein
MSIATTEVFSSVIGQTGVALWHIDNYSLMTIKDNIYFDSPILVIAGSKWKIRLHPGGQVAVGYITPATKKVGFYITSLQKITARAELSFPNLTTTPDFWRIPSQDWDIDTSMGWRESEYLTTELNNKLLKDRFTIQVKIWVSGTTLEHLDVPITLLPTRVYTKDLCDELGELLRLGKKTDVVLLVNGDEINVHRLILEMRSPVFEAMFTHKMTESLTGEVEICNIRTPVFREFLKFIYTGSLENKETEFVCELFAVANQYQVSSLIHCCSNILIGSIQMDNVICLLQMSEKFKAEDLKMACLQLITSNHEKMKTLINSSEAKSLSVEILKDVMNFSMQRLTCIPK